MQTLKQAILKLDRPYSSAFLQLLCFVMSHETEFHEGHYGNYDEVRTEHDPRDPGGATKYGIDQRAHPHLKVAELSFNEAALIYYTENWMPLRAEELPPKTAMALVDAAINCGGPRAVRWLQEILALKQDGNIGPVTIAAAQKRQDQDLAKAFNHRRMRYYSEEVRSGLRMVYLKGWTARVNDLQAALA